MVDMRTRAAVRQSGHARHLFGRRASNNSNADKLGRPRLAAREQHLGQTSASWSASPACATRCASTGFETIGWTNPNLSPPAPECDAAAHRATTPAAATGRFPARCPPTPATASPPAPSIDQAFLLAHNPGAHHPADRQRHHPAPRPPDRTSSAPRTATAACVSLEWRPSDASALLRRRACTARRRTTWSAST